MRWTQKRLQKVLMLTLLLTMLLLLAGCNGTERANTVYRSENYRFSLSIPNEIYEGLIIEDEAETGRVAFIHYHEEADSGIPVWGHIFRIHILPQSAPGPAKEYGGVYELLAQDDQYNYYFWYMIPDQCESLPLREVCEPIFDMIKKIPDSFVLDDE